MPHFCYSVFWGDAAFDLVTILDGVARGDARKMLISTYQTLCVVQREIERASGFPFATIPPPIVGSSPFPDTQEALLRAVAQQFLAALVADQFDNATSDHHGARFLQTQWMSQAGVAEDGALVQLTSFNLPYPSPPPPPPPPPPPFPPLTSVLGRVRNALGS